MCQKQGSWSEMGYPISRAPVAPSDDTFVSGTLISRCFQSAAWLFGMINFCFSEIYAGSMSLLANLTENDAVNASIEQFGSTVRHTCITRYFDFDKVE
jgi:hypothetical protein